MNSFAAKIETLEHRSMRAWMQGDRKQLKELTARDFIFLFGALNAEMLDRASWLEAASTRFSCASYRFGEVYVRRHGSFAVFATRITIESRLSSMDWSGEAWLTDLWHRSPVRRKWRLIERMMSRPLEDEQLPREIRALQLWR